MSEHYSRRRFVAAAGTVAIGVGLAGCGGDSGDNGGGEDNTVEMTNELTYEPETITVGVGETVVWDNVGSLGHSVTAYEDEIPSDAAYFASGDFDSEQAARDAYSMGDSDSGDIGEGETYEHTFDTAGTYEYFCIPHENAGMVGTVDVQDS